VVGGCAGHAKHLPYLLVNISAVPSNFKLKILLISLLLMSTLNCQVSPPCITIWHRVMRFRMQWPCYFNILEMFAVIKTQVCEAFITYLHLRKIDNFHIYLNWPLTVVGEIHHHKWMALECQSSSGWLKSAHVAATDRVDELMFARWQWQWWLNMNSISCTLCLTLVSQHSSSVILPHGHLWT